MAWNGTQRGHHCFFFENDLKKWSKFAPTIDACIAQCKKLSACTHYVWTPLHNYTCWPKEGYATKADAVFFPDVGTQCGLLANRMSKPDESLFSQILY